MSNTSAPGAVRVLHFVTGGLGSGAAQVAITLVSAAQAGQAIEPLLVLRRKRSTDPQKLNDLRAGGLPIRLVAGWPHWLTIWQLIGICRSFRPQVLVAHGYREHIWGRLAGLLAQVPNLVHVEHSTRERYSWWRLWQAHWLSRRTARIVGCSEGVRQRLLQLGFPPQRTIAIPNGIRLEPFAVANQHEYTRRTPGIVMCARFARQKDHLGLIRAIALLRDRGLHPPVLLAGGGKASHRRAAERLVRRLGLNMQVRFLGQHGDIPSLLMQHQICVLTTHYEGMPLALVEGMAAGCAVVGSEVPGVRELIRDGIDGRLVPAGSPCHTADVLESLLRNPSNAAALALRARRRALEHYSLERMNQNYESLFLDLASQRKLP